MFDGILKFELYGIITQIVTINEICPYNKKEGGHGGLGPVAFDPEIKNTSGKTLTSFIFYAPFVKYHKKTLILQ